MIRNIVVNVKIVPEKISFDRDSCRIRREGNSIFNPLDLIALEEAVKIKRKTNAFVSVVSMAPLKEKVLLSKLFKYGVDRVILLSDIVFAGSDTIATSYILKEAILKLGIKYDLILQGDFSLDGSTGNVGGEIAAFLGIPYLSNAISIEIENRSVVVKRCSIAVDTFKVDLPALISVRGEANNGSIIDLFSLEQSTSKEVEVFSNNEIQLDKEKFCSKTSILSLSQNKLENSFDLIKNGGEKILLDFLKKEDII